MATKKKTNPEMLDPAAPITDQHGNIIETPAELAASKAAIEADDNAIISSYEQRPVMPNAATPVISADSHLPINDVQDLSSLPIERQNRIISITGKLEAPTPEKEALITMQEIYSSRDSHTYLTGTVTGLKQMTFEGVKVPVAIVDYFSIQVYIRPEHFIPDPTRADGPRTREELQAAYIRQSIGSQVDFIVTKITPEDDNTVTVTGNRVAAMKVKRFNRYFGWNGNGTPIPNRKPYMYEGARAEARVVAVKTKYVRLEVMGVICSALSKDMSHTYVEDLRTLFAPGDLIVVRINKMVLNEETGDVQLEVSYKDAQENPKIKNFHKYNIDDVRLATVVAINKGGIFVNFEDGVECRCPYCPPPVRPVVGKRVQVKIKHKDPAKYNLFGIINRVIDL